MKKLSLLIMITVAGLAFGANAQFKLNVRTTDAAKKISRSFVYSDEDAAQQAKQAVEWMDNHNEVAAENDSYATRMRRIFAAHANEDGLSLNYKVYKVTDINAFACADGSVRVFSALMDIMTDEELLAIIGHEIGHVKNHDSRDAMKAAYMRTGGKELAASQSNKAAILSETQLGDMAEGMISSNHSRKQESEADDYSYEFLKKHNYNVLAAYTAFMKLTKLSEAASEQSRFQKMFNSHPDSKARAEEIERKARKDGFWKEPVYLIFDGTQR
ncbi:MAG: M48 family metallopeptidase [Ferruginibacter sp.]